MKKTTILLFTMLLSFGLFAQNQGNVAEKTNHNLSGQKSADPEVEITLVEVTKITAEINYAPNEACASYYFMIGTAESVNNAIMFGGGTIESAVKYFGIMKTANYTHIHPNLDGGTEYFVYVLPLNSADEEFAIQNIVFTTPTGGGTGLAEIDIQVSEITENSVRMIATPNDQTAVFHDGLIKVSYYNEIGAEEANEYFKNDGEPQYQTENWVWADLEPETAYYAIALGKNANDEWGPTKLVEFTTLSSTSIINPEVEITLIEVTKITAEINYAPNEACASYYFMIGTEEGINNAIMFGGGTIELAVKQFGIMKTANHTHLHASLDGGTEYFVYVLPLNSEDEEFAIQNIVFTTPTGGGTGLAEIDIQVSEITENSVRMIATPNDQTAVFHDGLIKVSYYNEIGAEEANEYFKNDGLPQYQTENWTWPELESGTAYYAIALGKNANNEWGPTKLVEFTTLSPTSILNNNAEQSKISIFPNPSNGTFTFKSLAENSGKIAIYNISGQKVLEQLVNSAESWINADGLANGLYQVIFTGENSTEIESQKLIINK